MYSTFNVTENTAATPHTDVETTGVFCEVDVNVLNNILVGNANVYQSSQAHGNTPDYMMQPITSHTVLLKMMTMMKSYSIPLLGTVWWNNKTPRGFSILSTQQPMH